MLLLSILPAPKVQADIFISEDIMTDPSPEEFSICYDNSCDSVTHVSLTESEWQSVRDIFIQKPDDASQERGLIASTIGYLEQIVGKKTGTYRDKAKNFNGRGLGGGQLDCIDESTNTTLYLMMLYKDGLIQYHGIEDRVTRGFFLFGWPHTTAVIRELESSQAFAIDSWFYDNGIPPAVLPLQVWQSGWEPGPE